MDPHGFGAPFHVRHPCGPSQATVERALASTEQVRINGSWQQVTEARPGWAAEELVRDAA